MRILSIDESLDILIKSLSKEQVYFTRFGDNDIFQMSGTDYKDHTLKGRTIGGNRTVFSKSLQKEMKEAFQIKDDSYLIACAGRWETEPGMKDGIFKAFPYKDSLDKKVSKFTTQETFLNPILFHYLSLFRKEQFKTFLNLYVRPKVKLYVGSVEPYHVSKITGNVDFHVKTPDTGSYESINEWYPEVIKILENNHIELVIPSTGQASRILSKRLFKEGYILHSIDFGSVFDAVAGKDTRTWIKQMGRNIIKNYK